MSLCSVGLYMNSECNKLPYSRIVGVKYLESFERDELELIFWRPGLTIFNIKATCSSSFVHSNLRASKDKSIILPH